MPAVEVAGKSAEDIGYGTQLAATRLASEGSAVESGLQSRNPKEGSPGLSFVSHLEA
jgi:hypothetical protein